MPIRDDVSMFMKKLVFRVSFPARVLMVGFSLLVQLKISSVCGSWMERDRWKFDLLRISEMAITTYHKHIQTRCNNIRRIGKTSAGGSTIMMRIPIPATLTPTPKKLLSFAEEEEEDREQAVSRIPSKLKPSSSSSHKLTSSQDKPPPTTSHSTTASNHKATVIEGLEEKMQKLHEARASVFLERKTTDNDDEMMEQPLHQFPGKISKSTGEARYEFGRDIKLQKRMDMERMDKACQCRKARFDSKRLSSMEIDSSTQKIEGRSGMDENDSD
ncbi:hypothetical protein DKX38_016732 [Salix brachista]|uniref:Uncharacterized protein n=1 Tax=Salix brachista TaxID=2182728 RepID=A0A5N5L8S6_9ROSI|nr:hypothetical protein DKX38_016732 [Salix brachista]